MAIYYIATNVEVQGAGKLKGASAHSVLPKACESTRISIMLIILLLNTDKEHGRTTLQLDPSTKYSSE
jgi:hypothetical protein